MFFVLNLFCWLVDISVLFYSQKWLYWYSSSLICISVIYLFTYFVSSKLLGSLLSKGSGSKLRVHALLALYRGKAVIEMLPPVPQNSTVLLQTLRRAWNLRGQMVFVFCTTTNFPEHLSRTEALLQTCSTDLKNHFLVPTTKASLLMWMDAQFFLYLFFQ